jgi:hypothetical protein
MRTLARVVVCSILMSGCATSTPLVTFSNRAADVHEVVFQAGSTNIRVKLDREYLVREMHGRPRTEARSLRVFQFIPRDEQSAATFAIGIGGHPFTEEVIAKMHEGATVTKVAGMVAGNTVEWWDYKDSRHLYSTCKTSFREKSGVDDPVYIDLVANTSERLSSLRDAFSRIALE